MACKIVDAYLQKFFYWLGYQIGLRPGYFLIVPLLLTALCATGFQRMDYEYDPEYLFSPWDGPAKHERAVMENHFPTNYSAFKSSRMTRPGKFGRLVIAAEDGGSMLRTERWNQLLYLDQIVYNITVEHEGKLLRYEDMCAKYNSLCYDNEILGLSDLIPSIESGDVNLTYPVYFNPSTFMPVPLPAYFGGVEMSDMNTITAVRAISLAYFLDVSEDWMTKAGDKWEKGLLNDVQGRGRKYAPDLKVGMFVSNTPAWEMEKARLSVTFTLCLNIAAMVVFTMLATTTSDAARSKPLTGLAGLLSASLALLAGFGFCCYIGIEFVSLNMAAPFLLLGIGIDDTFVMLSSWRRAEKGAKSLADRMGKCFGDAAVSITVTSLTNFLSFMTGVITPFPCVRIFCIYTGVSVAFIYMWQCTLFGAFLAYGGMMEEKRMHGFCCLTVTPKSMAKDRGVLYRFFLTGGVNPADPDNPEDNKDHAGMAFFRDKFGVMLTKGWVKSVVLVCYVAYLVAACWGVTQVREGLEKKNTANYNSYSVEYYDMEEKYFKEYAFAISVAFTGPNLDFSDKKLQQKIELIMSEFENSTYIDGKVTQSWLRDFLDYVRRNQGYDDVDLRMDTAEDFANTLKTLYLTDSSNPMNLDLEYSPDGKRVAAARFLIQGHNILTSFMEQQMVADLREICARYSTDELEVTVFQPFFIYIDQFLEIRPQTIQCVLVTALIMVIIALIFIPSIVCCLWVSLSIISIEVGVVGYMTWWGVNLDGVALINLIMCIGFSVDFSAHISYHYLTEVNKTPEQRIRGSLYALGLPILQAAGSTILAVIGLAFAPSYLFVTFFKMIFLVILLGILHGLVLLPVLLSLFGPGSCTRKKSKSTRSSGLSTPTMCYTVNQGYVPDNVRGGGNGIHCHNYSHHSGSGAGAASANKLVGSGMMNRWLEKDLSQQKLSYVMSSYIGAEEGEEDKRVRESYNPSSRGQQQQRHQQARAVKADSSPKTAATEQQGKKAVGRSKSHRPQSYYVAPAFYPDKRSSGAATAAAPAGSRRQQTTAATAVPDMALLGLDNKAPLRRFHSVPYHEFINDTEYSSDDSVRIAVQNRINEGLFLKKRQQQSLLISSSSASNSSNSPENSKRS